MWSFVIDEVDEILTIVLICWTNKYLEEFVWADVGKRGGKLK
jgi:hypothetical protein